jgi:hypothetical protein
MIKDYIYGEVSGLYVKYVLRGGSLYKGALGAEVDH